MAGKGKTSKKRVRDQECVLAGAKLFFLRTKILDVTQEKLLSMPSWGEKLGNTSDAAKISRWENGKRPIKLKYRKLIAAAFDIPEHFMEDSLPMDAFKIEVRNIYRQLDTNRYAEKISTIRKKKIVHNLPRPDYENFVGRNDELEKIMMWLSSKSRRYQISITGIGGVGKTALALEAAYRCKKNSDQKENESKGLWFDAIVFTSAKNKNLVGTRYECRSSVQSNLHDIILKILEVVAPDQCDSNTAPEKMIQIAREFMEQNRVLLVVDNMETVTDNSIREFLAEFPGQGKVIITDRRRVFESRPIQLFALPAAESRQLVRNQIKIHGIEINEKDGDYIADKAWGLPLAIILAIRLMAVRGWDAKTVFKHLCNSDAEGTLDFLFRSLFSRYPVMQEKYWGLFVCLKYR